MWNGINKRCSLITLISWLICCCRENAQRTTHLVSTKIAFPCSGFRFLVVDVIVFVFVVVVIIILLLLLLLLLLYWELPSYYVSIMNEIDLNGDAVVRFLFVHEFSQIPHKKRSDWKGNASPSRSNVFAHNQYIKELAIFANYLNKREINCKYLSIWIIERCDR